MIRTFSQKINADLKIESTDLTRVILTFRLNEDLNYPQGGLERIG